VGTGRWCCPSGVSFFRQSPVRKAGRKANPQTDDYDAFYHLLSQCPRDLRPSSHDSETIKEGQGTELEFEGASADILTQALQWWEQSASAAGFDFSVSQPPKKKGRFDESSGDPVPSYYFSAFAELIPQGGRPAYQVT